VLVGYKFPHTYKEANTSDAAPALLVYKSRVAVSHANKAVPLPTEALKVLV
jgi:hypothetical protein